MKINQRYSAQISGIKASVWLEGDEHEIQVRYARHTKLGARLLANAGSERLILANYIVIPLIK